MMILYINEVCVVICCGFMPYFIDLIVFAKGVMKFLIALASVSCRPMPPSPVGVVDRYQACVGMFWSYWASGLSIVF